MSPSTASPQNQLQYQQQHLMYSHAKVSTGAHALRTSAASSGRPSSPTLQQLYRSPPKPPAQASAANDNVWAKLDFSSALQAGGGSVDDPAGMDAYMTGTPMGAGASFFNSLGNDQQLSALHSAYSATITEFVPEETAATLKASQSLKV